MPEIWAICLPQEVNPQQIFDRISLNTAIAKGNVFDPSTLEEDQDDAINQ